MRPSSILIVGSLFVVGAACSKKKADDKPVVAGSGSAQPDPIVPKKPVDTRPLPGLTPDPGGATGKVTWAIGLGGMGIEGVRDVATGASGDIYLVGNFDGEADFKDGGKVTAQVQEAKPGEKPDPKAPPKKPTSDVFITKIGGDGKVAWAKSVGAKREDIATAVAVAGDRVVVAGYFADELTLGSLKPNKAAGSDDVFVAALDSKGDAQWLWTAGGIDSDGANAVAPMPDGGWIVGGSFSATATFGPTTVKSRGGTDAMLVKLSAGGEIEWVKQFGGGDNDAVSHVAVDAQGNIYIQGIQRAKASWGGEELAASTASSYNDIVLAKYDSNGDHKWSKRFGDGLEEDAGGLAIDPAGNIVMTGGFKRSISFGEGDDHKATGGDKSNESDIFVARFDGTGKLGWAKTWGSARPDYGFGIATDASGNAVVTGWYETSIDFGKGAMASKGNKDAFAVKLDPKGEVVWAQTWGDKDHDQGRAVATDDKGAVVVAGLYRFKLSLATPPVDSTRAPEDKIPPPDIYVAKLER